MLARVQEPAVRLTAGPATPENGCSAELVACRGELMAILDAIEMPAILVDPGHRILAANRCYRLAYAAGTDVSGRRCYEASHHASNPCDQLGEECPMARCCQTGEPARVLHVHHTPHGEEHHDVTAYPVLAQDGRLRAFLEIVRPCKAARAHPDTRRLVGRSDRFNRMLGLIQRVAPTGTTVLLLGESGTGKELVAHAIHEMSPRAARPFVPVDCSGLSESLFESELFGHERGAFTGAFARKRGLVESAEGGTLFLDEVGDIPLNLQVKLLRLIETASFRRVGSVVPSRADFRLVCATHRDLADMVARGEFRADLYFRISPYPLSLPALRHRVEDIPLLAETMLRRVAPDRELALSPEALAVLQHYDFPGNVRELLNILERASLLADGRSIEPQHLPDICFARSADAYPLTGGPQIERLDEIEGRYLRWAAARCNGSNTTLARELGLRERTFYRKMRKARALRPERPCAEARTIRLPLAESRIS